MKNCNSKFKINKIIFSFFLFSIIYSLLSIHVSPVFAQDCGEDPQTQGSSCCSIATDICLGTNHGEYGCGSGYLCCTDCQGPEGNEDGITNPVIGLFGKQAGNLTLAYLLAQFLRVSLVAAGILLLVYLVITGIQWLTSGGEKTAVAAAKERMTAAFIGLIIIILVIVVINLINNIFGLNILEPELPTP